MTSPTAFERCRGAWQNAGLIWQDGASDTASAQAPGHSAADRSISFRQIEGQVLVNSFSDDKLDVLAAVGLTLKDLFDNPAGARYDYGDGRQVFRTPDKKFRQSGNTKGRSLFRTKFDHAERVTVAEGEKDVLALESIGAAATCSAMGAGKAHLFDWTPLRGKHVRIVADKDEPGRKHAAQVAGLLDGIAASVSIFEAAVGKDPADHVAAGKTIDEFVPVAAEGDREVDGARLLDDIASFIGRYLVAPSRHCITALALWAVHTWCVLAFYVTPRLVIDSPEPGSGKTRVLELLRLLCREPELTISTTTAALYRLIDAAGDAPPTVLQDESDAVFGKSTTPQTEDLRALYNAGYKRGATVARCEGDAKNMRVRRFPVFAPVALAGIAGKMPATITTRSVTMHWRKRAPGESVAEFRERDADLMAAPLRDRIKGWAEAHLEELSAARPAMPTGIQDRPAEVWEALLAVADAAGGEWPDRARAACRHFVLDTEPEELSMGARLLRDIRTGFGDRERMFTVDILSVLTADEESEWCDLWGKPIDTRRLAKELKRYGVKSKDLRIGEGKAKGYEVSGADGLAQAWERYVPAENKRDKRDKGDIAGQRVSDVSDVSDKRDKRDTSETEKMVAELQIFEVVSDVSDVSLTDGSRTGRTDLTGCTGIESTAETPRSDAPPGGITAATPGMTDRVQQILARTNGFDSHPACWSCDRPVTDRRQDEHGRFIHAECEVDAA